MEFRTPVLFIVFNRIEQTKKVFETIKNQKPTKLFISSDGARNEEERLKVLEIREYLIREVNWKCELHTKFNDSNLGCSIGPSSAITWFFSNVDKGIILEDDCLPNESFFKFCSHYLQMFEQDKSIWHIAGNNLLGNFRSHNNSDIIYSNFNFIWGWATWADRWIYFDSKLSLIKSDSFIDNIFSNKKDQKFWKSIFHRVKYSDSVLTCWDYQWTFTCWEKGGKSIVSSKNLVQNIGFSNDATHTNNPNPFIENLNSYKWEPTSKKTNQLIVNKKFDEIVQRKFFRYNFYVRIILKLYKIFSFKK